MVSIYIGRYMDRYLRFSSTAFNIRVCRHYRHLSPINDGRGHTRDSEAHLSRSRTSGRALGPKPGWSSTASARGRVGQLELPRPRMARSSCLRMGMVQSAVRPSHLSLSDPTASTDVSVSGSSRGSVGLLQPACLPAGEVPLRCA